MRRWDSLKSCKNVEFYRFTREKKKSRKKSTKSFILIYYFSITTDIGSVFSMKLNRLGLIS